MKKINLLEAKCLLNKQSRRINIYQFRSENNFILNLTVKLERLSSSFHLASVPFIHSTEATNWLNYKDGIRFNKKMEKPHTVCFRKKFSRLSFNAVLSRSGNLEPKSFSRVFRTSALCVAAFLIELICGVELIEWTQMPGWRRNEVNVERQVQDYLWKLFIAGNVELVGLI